jgi:hypothetical protein
MTAISGINGLFFSGLSCANVTSCVADGSIGNDCDYGVRATEVRSVWSVAATRNGAFRGRDCP